MSENEDVTSRNGEQKASTTCASGPMRDVKTMLEMAAVNLEVASKYAAALATLQQIRVAFDAGNEVYDDGPTFEGIDTILKSVGITSERETMMRLWITRDANSETIYAWGTQPVYGLGEWDKGGVHPIVYPVTESFVKAILGDAWCDDGEFCFEMDFAIGRVLSRPQTLANELRAMTNETCCGETLVEAADLIDSLSKK